MGLVKIKNKAYSFGNFPETEAFLSEEHAKGHRFVGYETNLLSASFVFEECEPDEVLYRLDYGSISDMEAYKATFSRRGWDYIGSKAKFHLFCKKKSAEGDPDLFPDNRAKAQMCKKVIAGRTALMMLFIFVLNAANLCFQLTDFGGLVSVIFSIGFIGMGLAFILCIVAMLRDLFKLNAIIATLEEPEEETGKAPKNIAKK